MSESPATYTVRQDTTCWLPCPCGGNPGCEACEGSGYVDAKRVAPAKDTEHDLLWRALGLD